MSHPDVDAMAAEVVSLIKSALAPVQARIAALEATAPDLPPADLAASFTGLLTKELEALGGTLARPLIQKRIVRGGDGKIERVVEEPAV